MGAGVTMRLDLLEEFSEGFDPETRASVLENLRLGFPLSVEEPPPPRSWAQSFLSDESRIRITSYFEAEVTDRRMLGPFTTPPSGEFWGKAVAFPVSEVDKSDGKYRTIFNLSYDLENSTTAGIPKAAGFTTYPSFERVAMEMTDIGLQSVYFAMFDIQTAFRQLRIRPEDWIYQVVAWQRTKNGPREWYIDLALPFGIRIGPAVFNRFGDLLHFILQQTCLSPEDKELVGKLIRYLDDHLVLGLGRAETDRMLDSLLAMMEKLEIPVKDSKTIRAVPEVKFIGYFWQPRSDRVTLDKERWAKLEHEMRRIDMALDTWEVSINDVRSLSGVLCWASKVIE